MATLLLILVKDGGVVGRHDGAERRRLDDDWRLHWRLEQLQDELELRVLTVEPFLQ